MKCFLCSSDKFKTVYTSGEFKIVSCVNDDLYFKIATGDQKNLYDKDYFEAYPYSNFLNLNKIYFKNKVRRLIKLQPHPKRSRRISILDIGCGWGDFLEVCRDENIPYLGIDDSPEAIEICKKKHLNCHRGIEFSQHKEFDAITLFQTIEHIQNPHPLLKSASKLLKPGGIILITTPNNDSPLRKLNKSKWSVYNTNSHFVFYNKKTLKQTLAAAGFKNVEVKIDSPRLLSLKYILSRLNFRLLTLNFDLVPIPTDPLGDLQAIGFKS